MTSFILRIFFIIPIWLLRVLTMKKKIMKNNQILDFQTQIFLSLQSLQSADLESFELIESVDEFRREMTESRMGLPINAKPDSIVTSIDHQINIEEDINLSIWPLYHDYEIKNLSFNVTLDNFLLGDINFDQEINILDVVLAINIVLSDEYNNIADLNSDNTVDI